MSYDIVTRLRKRYCSHGNNYDGAWQPVEWPSSCERCELDKQAADTIEQLSTEVSRLMQIICDASPDDDYFLIRRESDAIWEKIYKDNEAVRGE